MAEDDAALASGAPKSLFYVLVSVPAPDGVDPVYRTHCERTTDIASSERINVPNLKVGTLDTLMNLSDVLSKLDGTVESTLKRMNQTLGDLVNAQPVWTVNSLLPDAYLSQFQWDLKKFAPEKALNVTVAAIQSTVEKAENELKNKSAAYQTLARAIAAESRKDTGTLATRSLHDIIKPEMMVETEYLTTLLIVVPKHQAKEFLDSYESLTQFVLPRSAVLVKEDQDFSLYTVTLFKRVAEEFKNIAREKRYTVRDFSKDSLSKESKEEREKKVEEKAVQEARLIKWLKATIGEVFLNWVHLKIVRAHVESVLRYGLPPKYGLFLMKSTKKDEKKLMAALIKLYAGLAGPGQASMITGPDEVMPGAAGAQEKFLPFVYSLIDIDLASRNL